MTKQEKRHIINGGALGFAGIIFGGLIGTLILYSTARAYVALPSQVNEVNRKVNENRINIENLQDRYDKFERNQEVIQKDIKSILRIVK